MEARFRNCEEVQQELMSWLAGELPETDKQTLAAHLAQCPDCQHELEGVQQLWTAMGNLPVPAPSEELRPNFYAMLAEFKAEEQQRQRWSMAGLLERLRQWWQPAFAQRLAYSLVLVLAGLGIGYGLRGHETSAGAEEPLAQVSTESPASTARQVGLISRLNNPSAVQRLQAVSEAEQVAPTNERVLAALLSTLNQDPNVNVRLATLDALGSMADDPTVRQGLVRSLTYQESPLVQSALADLMVQLQERRSVRPLRKLLQQDNLNEQVKTKIEQSIQSLSHDRAPAAPSTPSNSNETTHYNSATLDTSVAA
ncbi:HEAT repeat domain-containing protein [Hymenobacter guriensis]|uniref:HEAT repeat domain-containing protein n=1 Tax=Hymenobacter guriensis TaxID=2793065 RepID=A0ABS0L181_9BACT|nr:HEAT repeat domain-containing protein [Hymenobacter guriensis]MBG8553866.1 HEAT repeat domain-containing protein [Hymenobacter guriensis]